MSNFFKAIFLMVFPAVVFATTLEDIVNPLASSSDWADIDHLKGVKWSHKGTKEIPMAPFSKSGIAKINNLGSASLVFAGVRTIISELNVSVENKDYSDKPSDYLKSQFSNKTIIRTIRDVCKDEVSGMSKSSVFEINMKDKSPVYLFLSIDAGGNSPNSSSIEMQFSLENEQRWGC